MNYKLYNDDCFNVLKMIDDNSIDGVVTDPPYGLSKQPDIKKVLEQWLNDEEYKHNSRGFMGNFWDSFVPNPLIWKEVYRVLKPGGHALVFAGTRTQDLMSIALRLAGFEIRDCINYFYDDNYDLNNFVESLNDEQKGAFFKLLDSENGNMFWVNGSGFPKSLNIGKAIDKMKGKKGDIIDTIEDRWNGKGQSLEWSERKNKGNINITELVSEEAKKYQNYGTGIKPAYEPIIIVRKPISEKNIAENVLRWNTGGLNIESCKIPVNKETKPRKHWEEDFAKKINFNVKISKESIKFLGNKRTTSTGDYVNGRFPANIIIDDSEEVKNLFPYTKSGELKSHHKMNKKPQVTYGKFKPGFIGDLCNKEFGGDKGSAGRFFYCSKASQKERNLGLENSKIKEKEVVRQGLAGEKNNPKHKNSHPTVKPLDLITYLVKLISPPDNCVILDPFMGSGTTGLACKNIGVNFIGIELEEKYFNIAKTRIENYNEIKIKTKEEILSSPDPQLDLF